MHHAVTMYNYHVWANRRIMNRLKELPEELYSRQLQNSSFTSIALGMAHIYMVDKVWIEVLSGVNMRDALAQERGREADLANRSLEELEALYSELAERYKAFLRGQDDLETRIVLDNPYAGIRETSLAEIVLQLVNHATYHRGNITTMLHTMGHSSIMTEYALFWYQGEAESLEPVAAE
jgi:uncharacterized damage-inducible protein DinB